MLEKIEPQEVTAAIEAAKPPELVKKKKLSPQSRENGKKGGRPKGSLNKETKEVKAAAEIYRDFMTAEMKPLIKAQLAVALGYYKAVTIGKGKNKRVVDAYLTDPSGGNIENILNRVLGKPKDGSMEEVSKSIAEVGQAMRSLLTKKK